MPSYHEGGNHDAKIIWAALNCRHTTREEIEGDMGLHGLDALDELLDEGILKEEDGLIVGLHRSEYGADMEYTREDLQTLTQLWRPYQAGNLGYVASRGLNMEFAKHIYGRLEEVFREYLEGAELPENRGDIHVGVGVIMSNFLKTVKKDETIQ